MNINLLYKIYYFLILYIIKYNLAYFIVKISYNLKLTKLILNYINIKNLTIILFKVNIRVNHIF
jgi:hypothetical protein